MNNGELLWLDKKKEIAKIAISHIRIYVGIFLLSSSCRSYCIPPASLCGLRFYTS